MRLPARMRRRRPAAAPRRARRAARAPTSTTVGPSTRGSTSVSPTVAPNPDASSVARSKSWRSGTAASAKTGTPTTVASAGTDGGVWTAIAPERCRDGMGSNAATARVTRCPRAGGHPTSRASAATASAVGGQMLRRRKGRGKGVRPTGSGTQRRITIARPAERDRPSFGGSHITANSGADTLARRVHERGSLARSSEAAHRPRQFRKQRRVDDAACHVDQTVTAPKYGIETSPDLTAVAVPDRQAAARAHHAPRPPPRGALDG